MFVDDGSFFKLGTTTVGVVVVVIQQPCLCGNHPNDDDDGSTWSRLRRCLFVCVCVFSQLGDLPTVIEICASTRNAKVDIVHSHTNIFNYRQSKDTLK